MKEPTYDWQTVSAGNTTIFLRCLLKTVRLVNGPAEAASVFRFFFKLLVWRLRGSSGAEQDQTLRLHGVTHVLGLGTGELLMPQEIYWEGGYDRVPDFVPRAGWVVFDVGANAGVYAVQQAQRGAVVYAVEPNPDCYRRLQKSVRANALEGRVTALNCALGSVAGPAQLLVPDGLTSMGSLRPGWTTGARRGGMNINVDTLDEVVRRLAVSRIDLLKVDVEGLELDVLQGAHSTIDLVDRLVLEYHSVDLGGRVADLLAARGFTIVLDQKMYHGDESKYGGVGRGLLFAKRQTSAAGAAVA